MIDNINILQCKDFENDFKMERQEKEKLDSDMKRIVKQCQDLQQENITVKNDNEKIKKLIKDEFERKQQKQVRIFRKAQI